MDGVLLLLLVAFGSVNAKDKPETHDGKIFSKTQMRELQQVLTESGNKYAHNLTALKSVMSALLTSDPEKAANRLGLDPSELTQLGAKLAFIGQLLNESYAADSKRSNTVEQRLKLVGKNTKAASYTTSLPTIYCICALFLLRLSL